MRNIRGTMTIASWLILSAAVPQDGASIVTRSFGVSPTTTVTPTVFPLSITSVPAFAGATARQATCSSLAGSASDFR